MESESDNNGESVKDQSWKSVMVLEVVQQNLKDPDFVDWLFTQLGLAEVSENE